MLLDYAQVFATGFSVGFIAFPVAVVAFVLIASKDD